MLVVVDQRSDMFFGSRYCFKSTLAGHIAGLLAWSALNRGDRVGGLIFNDTGHREIRPRRSRKTVLTLLSQVVSFNHALPGDNDSAAASFATMLSNLRRIARPGSSLFLISDFRGAADEIARKHLFELAKHTEMTALECADPMESQLPRGGMYAVTDGRERSELHTADRQLRRRFHRGWQHQHDLFAGHLRSLGVPLVADSTDQSPFTLLQTYYGDARR